MLGFRELMAASQQGGSTPTSTTWDPLAIGTGMTLSNGSLTVQASSSVTYTTARATTGKSAGKWYFETNLDAAYTNAEVGVSNSSANLNSYLGADANSWGYQMDGAISHNNSFPSSGITYTTGDVIGIAIDFGAGQLWLSKNGAWISGDPSTGTSPSFTGVIGTLFPAVSVRNNTTLGQWTGRFSAAQQTYAAPSGFTSWG